MLPWLPFVVQDSRRWFLSLSNSQFPYLRDFQLDSRRSQIMGRILSDYPILGLLFKDVPGFFFSFFAFYFSPSPSEFIQLLIKINTRANNPKSR